MGGRVRRLISEVVSARLVVVKPLVLLAAKAIGPGPLRLKMVKLAHELGDREVAPTTSEITAGSSTLRPGAG